MAPRLDKNRKDKIEKPPDENCTPDILSRKEDQFAKGDGGVAPKPPSPTQDVGDITNYSPNLERNTTPENNLRPLGETNVIKAIESTAENKEEGEAPKPQPQGFYQDPESLKKDKGPAWGEKQSRTPPVLILKLFKLYDKIAEESYWQKLPKDQYERNRLVKLILKPMTNLWRQFPSLDWWEKYFRAVSDHPGIQELVEGDKFIPSLPWLLEPGPVRKYLTGQYTDGELPDPPGGLDP